MSDIDVDALRKVAEAATPGPWDLNPVEGGVTDVLGQWVADGAVHRAPLIASTDDATAAHITAFDPPTVLALLDRIAELEAEVASLESSLQEAEWGEDR